MKLEGSLDAFSLPDIFQLLSFTKKSGGLHLRRASIHGCVYFRDGSVTGATSDDGRQALARRLVGSGAVGDDELAAAVERAVADGVGVGRALLDSGAIDAQLLHDLVSEQAVDAVFDFLRWSEGDFSFTVDEPGPDDIGVALGVEPIVTDARSRFETWESACRVIPSPDVVLALPVAVRDEPQVSRAEWALLALVDGRRSVADLIVLAGRGDYAVVSQLASLIERGLLALRVADAEEGAQALARRHGILARLETVAPAANGRRPDVPTRSADFAPLPTPQPETRDDRAVPNRPDATADESIFAGVSLGEVSSNSTVASVLAAAAGVEGSPFARTPAPAREMATSNGGGESASARFVADSRTPVTPARPEPFMPRRRPDYPEEAHAAASRGSGVATATAVSESEPKSHIERDPSVNKSLLLRLIAGVRGL